MSMDYQLAMPPLQVQLMLPPHIAYAGDMDSLEYALINPPPGFDMVPRLCPIQSESQRPNVCPPYMLPYPLRLIVINHRLAAYYLNELGQICLVAQLLDSTSDIARLSSQPPADIQRTELIYNYYHFDGAGNIVQSTMTSTPAAAEIVTGHCLNDELGMHNMETMIDNLPVQNLCSCQHYASVPYRYGSNIHSVHDGIDVFNAVHNGTHYEQIVEIDFGVNDLLYNMGEERIGGIGVSNITASSNTQRSTAKSFEHAEQKSAEKVPADGPSVDSTTEFPKCDAAPLKYRAKAGYIVEEPEEKLSSAKKETISAKA